jgi:hypothetical protein
MKAAFVREVVANLQMRGGIHKVSVTFCVAQLIYVPWKLNSVQTRIRYEVEDLSVFSQCILSMVNKLD